MLSFLKKLLQIMHFVPSRRPGMAVLKRESCKAELESSSDVAPASYELRPQTLILTDPGALPFF